MTSFFRSIISCLLFLALLATVSQLHAMQDAYDPQAARRAEIEETHHRLQLYQAARLAWIETVCQLNETQRKALHLASQQLLAGLSIPFERDSKDMEYKYATISDITLLQFHKIELGARSLHSATFEEQLQRILTQTQLNSYQNSLAKRNSRVNDGFASQITNIIDYDLYLTNSQREQIRLALSKEDLLDQKERLFPSHSFSIYRNLAGHHDSISDYYNPTQKSRWNDLTKRNMDVQGSVSICANEKTLSEWDLDLYQAAESVDDKYTRAIQVRTEYIAAYSHLTIKDSRTLNLAARGIACHDLAAWRRKMHSYYSQLADSMYASSCIIVDVPQRPRQLEHSPIWQTISTRYEIEPAMLARREETRAAAFLFIMSALDEELWLSDAQRLQMQPMISRTFQQVEVPTRSAEYSDYPDILFLARLLVQDSIKEIDVFLNDAQKEVFAELRSQFVLKNRAILWNTRYGKNILLGYIRDEVFLEEQAEG